MEPRLAPTLGREERAREGEKEKSPETGGRTPQALEKTLFEDAMRQALAIQQALLSTQPLRFLEIEVRSRYRQAGMVSGDFLDYFRFGESDLLGLYIGDVVGKGIPAALFGALSMGTLTGANKGGESPASVLEFVNRRLFARHVIERYCVVQYAVIDPCSHELRFSNAGMQPRPILISESGCGELGEGGFPCGMFENARYAVYTAPLNYGDSLLFSTDGFIDAVNADDQPFGVDRLLEVCEQSRGRPPEALLDRVFSAVDSFTGGKPQEDDMTAAAVTLLEPRKDNPHA